MGMGKCIAYFAGLQILSSPPSARNAGSRSSGGRTTHPRKERHHKHLARQNHTEPSLQVLFAQGNSMSDLPKKRSKLSVGFRCIFAFMGLFGVYGLLNVALVFATKGGRNALYDYGTFFLALAFGIGLSYLLAHSVAEFGHPVAPNWILKLNIGIGTGIALYFGYKWLSAVCILLAWYFFYYRCRADKRPATAASGPPTGDKAPQFQAATESPPQVKYVGLGFLLLSVIAVGIWHFSHSGPEPPPNVPSPSSGAAVPTGQQARVKAPVTEPGSAPAEAKVNPKDGLKYVWIPPGSFQMGCSPGDAECGDVEKPAHQVTITKGFWMGQTEVTVAAYRRFAGSTGAQMPPAPNFNEGWSNQDMPIVNVSWNAATAFCGWAGGRLPTEAEWEYAARAGSMGERYGPLDEVAWYWNNGGGKTHEVALKRPNAWNLYDTLGNVWEWVNDWFDPNYYQHSPSQDPPGPASGESRILRGGSLVVDPGDVRVSFRFKDYPGGMYDGVYGFRCGGEVLDP